jgi:fimbrial chaperone protein
MPILSRIAAVLAAVLQAASASAASLEVVPTTIELPAKGGPAQLRLVNHGDKPVNVQIETLAWKQDGNEALVDSDEIALSPPFAHLNPSSSQIVRLLLPPPAQPEAERAFRVLVTQLPDPNDKDMGAHVLLQFSVPLFASDGKAASLSWALHHDGAGLTLEAQNLGSRRAKFTNLELVTTEGRHLPVSAHGLVYVLAGATRRWALPDAKPSDRFRLEGDDDSAQRRFSISLDVTD